MDASLDTSLTVPDIWQQDAIGALRDGLDVVVDAPTGAGKTFIFELFLQQGFSGRAVFTVPTRALANDKLREWRARGWNAGIETGDISENEDAPVVVATLETQKRKLVDGRGPDLLVVDEYQMLADPSRGAHYELALALAPAATRLLLLSGSVANPEDVGLWLERQGRRARVIRNQQRPVPLDEAHLESLRAPLPRSVQGRWPRLIARALALDFGPLLIFAPMRRSAEALAETLAAGLPDDEPLDLTREQSSLAGETLGRLLRRRVALHHSGMRYAQRAGLVEPLAKHGQLRVIVATTGLAAGINFSVRSVLVLDREYRAGPVTRRLRPEELLQMFGRAGRRGLDERGTVLHLTDKPRLTDGRQARLERGGAADWPALLALMHRAARQGESPMEAARGLARRLFTRSPVRLGLETFLREGPRRPPDGDAPDDGEQRLAGGEVVEIRNGAGLWERRRAPVPVRLDEAWIREGEAWKPALRSPRLLENIRVGVMCRVGRGRDRVYGRAVPIASFPADDGDERLKLTKWARRALREHRRQAGAAPNVPRRWTLEAIESDIVPALPALTSGGANIELFEHNGVLHARLDYSAAEIRAYRDRDGHALLNPPQRKRRVDGAGGPTPGRRSLQGIQNRSVADQWHALGLIDASARPTRRGVLVSFFHHGEGLAVAAALEEPAMDIEALVFEIANIRAGHRFESFSEGGHSLGAICARAYQSIDLPGYLRRGLPEDFGEGAAELMRRIDGDRERIRECVGPDLNRGDIERVETEWLSLCNLIARAPDHPWERWRALQAAAARRLAARRRARPAFDALPPLSAAQKTRRAPRFGPHASSRAS